MCLTCVCCVPDCESAALFHGRCFQHCLVISNKLPILCKPLTCWQCATQDPKTLAQNYGELRYLYVNCAPHRDIEWGDLAHLLDTGDDPFLVCRNAQRKVQEKFANCKSCRSVQCLEDCDGKTNVVVFYDDSDALDQSVTQIDLCPVKYSPVKAVDACFDKVNLTQESCKKAQVCICDFGCDVQRLKTRNRERSKLDVCAYASHNVSMCELQVPGVNFAGVNFALQYLDGERDISSLYPNIIL
jgi:hypothetical protein